jgi:hypothetical protein
MRNHAYQQRCSTITRGVYSHSLILVSSVCNRPHPSHIQVVVLEVLDGDPKINPSGLIIPPKDTRVDRRFCNQHTYNVTREDLRHVRA